MKCSVFIATSADGFIATPDGGVDWLETAGTSDVDMGDDPDMGMNAFFASFDGMVMGRKCMEKISSFNLTPEQWPYPDVPIRVLSRTLSAPPDNLKDKMQIHSGSIPDLITELESLGVTHVYVDGGSTITSFLNLQLIDTITISRAPVILGEGIPLFGKTEHPIQLIEAKAKAYPNDFVQVRYNVHYS